jgi:hypothetical protein
MKAQRIKSGFVLISPPRAMKVLDDLAWCIGRDDCIKGLPPLRCLKYRPDKARHYLDGYEAQRREMA